VLVTVMLPPIWYVAKKNVFFNTNGHVYQGLADWFNIWDYYRPRMKMLDAARPGNVKIKVRGDLALVTDDRVTRTYEWLDERDGEPRFVRGNPLVRMTMVAERLDGSWKTVHVHFSERADGLRPDEAARQTA
jgi:hypothetical protein